MNVLFLFSKRFAQLGVLIIAISTVGWSQTASFTTTPAAVNGVVTVCQGSTILFTNTTTPLAGPTTYAWSFGNGQTSTTSSFNAITYSTTGTYTVTLNITDNGIAFQPATITVVVSGPPPIVPTIGPTNNCTQAYTSNGVTIFQTSSGNGCGCMNQNMGPAISLLNTNQYPTGTVAQIYWGGNGTGANGGTSAFTTFNGPFPTTNQNTTNFPGQTFSGGTNLGHYSGSGASGQGSYNLMYVLTFPNGCTYSSYYVMSWGAGIIDFCANSSLTACIPFNYQLCFDNQFPGNTYTIDWGDGSAPSVFSYPNLPTYPNVVPHAYAASCTGSGDAIDYTITVLASNQCPNDTTINSQGPFFVSSLPTANYTQTPGLTVCQNQSITFTNASNGGFSVASGNCTNVYDFAWYINNSSNTTGTGYTLTNGSLGDLGNFPAVNGSNAMTVLFSTPGTYTVSIEASNIDCGSDILTKTITVLPLPIVPAQTATICTGGTFNVSPTNNPPTTIVPNGTTYSWVPVDNPNVSLEASGSGSSMTGTLVNLTNVNQVVTYTVTPSAGGCTGPPFQLTVTIVPGIVIPNQTTTICSGGTFNVTPVNAPPTTILPAGTVFTWTPVNNPNVAGEVPGTGTSITGTLSTTQTTPTSVLYNVLANAGPTCPNAPFTVTVNINNILPGVVGANQTVCAGGNPNPFTFSTPAAAPGTIGYQWQSSGSASGPFVNIGGATSASYDPPANITATTYYQVVITSTLNGVACTSITNTVSVIVNPNPLVNAGADFTKTCVQNVNGLPIGMTAVNGINYVWTPTTGLSNPTSTAPTANPTVTTTYTLTATNATTGCITSDQVVVTVNTTPPIAAAGTDFTKTCTQNPNGLAIGAANNTQYSYLWTPSLGLSNSTVSNPTANPSVTTTYQVTVTDNINGCTATDEVIVTVNTALPLADAGTDFTKTCVLNPTGLPIGMTAVAGVTYAWNPTAGLTPSNSANPTANPTTTTTYTLTATNTSSGCTATDQVVVTVNTVVPVANAGLDGIITCTQNPSGFTVGVAPVNGVTYAWTPANTLNNAAVSSTTAQPTSTTTYTLTATNTSSGCTATDQVLVTVNTVVPVANAGNDFTKTCTQNPNGLQIGAAGVAGVTYAWSPNLNLSSATVANPTANPATTSTYTLVATNTASGCTATDQVTVTVDLTVPVANAGADFTKNCTQFVNGGTIGVAPVTGVTYSWSPTTGLSDPLIANPTANPTVTTTYTLTATNTASGCTLTDQVLVTVVTGLPTANAGADLPITCVTNPTGATIGMTAVVGITYSWTPTAGLSNPNVSNPTATPTSTTTYTLTATNPTTGCTASDNIIITVNNTLPVADAGADFTKTCVTNTAGLPIGMTAVAGITYSWLPTTALSAPNNANPTANPTATTTYTLTATNPASGCVATDQVVVTVNTTPPTAIAGPDVTVSCASNPTGASIGGPSSGTTTYSWTPSAGLSSTTVSNPTAQPTATTNYTVTATNPANGCTATDQVLVTVNTVVPVANAGNDFTKTCTQNPNGLQIGAAGVAGVTYAWSPNLNLSSATVANPTANPATTTTYTLVATNTASGCTATDQVTVTVDLTVPVANAGADFTKNCTQFVNGGTIGVAPVTGVTYSWSPATGLSDPLIANPNANPTVTTTYTLTATNTASGCTLTDQVLVTVVTGLPTANAGADLPITCVTNPTGATIGMTAVAGITYSWTPTAGLSNPNVSNPTATPTSTTTYTLTATNPTTGCTASDNIIITVNNTLPLADAGADFTKTCVTNTAGLPIGMTAVAGITYSWLPTTALSAPNNANPTANPTATTTYTLTATNPASGCVATDQVVVTVNTTPPTAIAGPDVTVSCASNPTGASIGGPSSGTTTYSWTPSAGLSSTTVSNPTAQPTATTNYTVTATNPANGCTATDQVLVTVNTVVPVANAGNDFTKTCITNALGATVGAASIAGLSYSWSPAAGLNFANISNPIANPTSTTTYTLTTTNIASGCSATDEVTVTVNTNTPTANAGGDFTTTCTQNTTGQVIGMSSVAGVTYSWTPTVGLSDPNVSNPTANPTTTTTYTLTATNTADGCTATDNIVVTVNTVAPSVAAGTDFNKTCLVNPNGLPIGMVQVIGVTYAWSPATGLTSTSISNPVANPTSTQTYTLTATNTANGCTATDAILVTVDIEVPSVNAGADFTKTCAVNASGLGVGMTPVTGVSYAWTPTSGLSSATIANPIANPSTTTTYTLTATDNSSGCTANDIVVVTVDAILPTINAGADQTICSGSSVTLTASGGNTYSWSNGYANGQAFIPVSTATYTVTGTNTSTGCTNTDQVVVTVNPIPTVANPTDQVLCNNATTTAITFSGTIPGTTFNWTNNNTAINLSAAGSSTVLPFVATNTSNAPVSGTIVVTPVFTSGGLTCTGTTQDVLITVNPTPTVNPIPNQTVCVGSSTTAVTFASTFNVANTSFAWTNNNTSINLGASGNTTVPSFASTNATNGPVTGTVTATPSYVNGGVTCVGTPQSFIITVNPIPSLTNPTDQVVCNNASTNAVNFVGPVAGTSFAWTNSNASINLGITGNGNILPFNATNNTNAAITGNIVVTPSYTNAGTTCTGSNQDIQITVNPTPTVDPILSQGKCVGTSTDAINFSSAFNVTGTTYAWTNSNTAINLPALGNGNIAPFTTTNTGNSPISGNIIVTPSYSNAGTSCPGTTQTFAITVNPIPTVANPTDQVVCNNAATAAIPFTGAVTGTVFNWTNSNTGINLAGSGNGNIFSFNATNNTNTAITGTLTVTPSYTNAGVTCTGTPQDALITVNPTPTIDPIANQTVCVGSPTSAVNFASTFNVTGTTYAWTNTNTAINLGASGNTNIAAFTSTNAGSTPISGTVSVTPSAANAGTTCVGTPQAFTITVNPIPTVSNPADQVVCNNAPTAAIAFSGTIAGTVFNWANNNTTINLGASGNGNISSFNATNTTSSPITGTIVVTPTFTNAGTACTGSTQDAVITVNPTPTVTDPSDQTVCNGSQVPATVFTGTGTTYNWINSTPSIGLGANGTGNISAFTATNISTNPVVAQVTVTPSFFNAGVTCTGTPNTYSITINPSPAVQFNQPNQTICAGGNTLPVTLTSQTPGATITWSVQTVPAAISGLTTVSGGTSIPSYTLTNSSSVPVTITFLAGASTPGLVNCPGAGSVYTITVNPTPQVNDPLDQVVCHTSSTTAVAFTGSANSYSWTNSTTSIGLAAGGTGNIAAFSAANTTSLPVVSTVVVTPIFTNNTVACSGSTQSFTYTINPTPTVNPTADITLCNGASSTAITFSGTGTSYNWTNNTTSIGLGASGSNTIASFTTNNSAATPVNATVNVTPIYTNGGVACSGPVDVFILQILPTSTMNDPLDQVACNNASVPATTFSGSGTGFSWINSTPSIGLALNGNGNVATFVGQNASTSPITATITVTPTYSANGVTCPGTDQAYTITVNPTPTAVDPADQVICNSTPSAQVVLSGTGTSYTWSNNTPSIGLAANGNTAVPVFTGQNNTANPVTGIITITPSFLGSGVTCQGPVQTFSITVNPTPGITDPLDAVVCNGALAPATNFTGTGTSYSWTNNTPSIGIPASGSGNIPTFTAVNASALPVVATLTVTPDFTGGAVGCTGVAQTFNITVNPTPTVGDLPDQVICNTTSTAALNFTGTGTSYTWVNSTPSIGSSANGTGDISAFTGTNTGSTAVIGTVTVTPQFANAGLTCSGSTQAISITVNPTPNVTDPTDIIVCNAAPTPAVNFVGTGTSYTWTNSNPLIGLAANGTGNIPTFNAINTGTTPIVATVIVTPNFTGGGLNCTGAPQTFTITINPTPTVGDPADQTVCNNSSTAAIAFAGTGTSYTWVNSAASIGLAANGTGDINAFTATNNSNNPVVATITLTPQYLNAGLTCSGTQQIFTITVNPAPTVQYSLANQTICSQANTNAINITSATPGAIITWSATTVPSTVTGLTSTSGDSNIPFFTLSNSGTNPAVIQITASAVTSGQAACPGSGAPYTITVNPTPNVTVPGDQVVCNAGTSNAVAFTGTGTSYTWTNSIPGIGLAATGTNTIAPFTVVNTGTSPVVSTISVTPQYTFNSVTCPGPSQNFTITVNPTPIVTPISDLTYCNNTLTNSVTIAGTGTEYTWSNSTTSIGLLASGLNTVPAFTTSNSGASPLSGTVTITPIFVNGGVSCSGPLSDYVITINPTPSLSDPTDQVVCNNTSTQQVVFNGTGTSYTWTNNTTSIGLGASGTGNIVAFTGLNANTVPVIAGINVTAQYTGGNITCAGQQQTFDITVNPTPTAIDPVDQVICNSASSAQVVLAGTGTSYAWTNNTPSIGLAANGNTTVPVFTGQNPGSTPVTGIITITPSYLGSGVTCQGPTQNFSITINPTPQAVDPQDLVVCNNALTPAINFTGTGTSYSWTNSTSSIGIPFAGVGNIPSFTAINGLTTPVIATLTVTPDFTGGSVGCTGATQTFTITINPTPTVNDLPDQIVCNGSSTSPLPFTGTGTSYTWVNSAPSIGLSANGSGTIGAFITSNSTSSPVNAIVTVTPQFANAGLTCSGTAQTIGLTVNPTPTVNDPADIVVCNGSPTTPVNFVGTGTSYIWTNSNPLIGLGANGTGNITSFNAVNTGTTPIVATITVTPTFVGGTANCPGAPQSFTITINPTPIANDPSDQVVCNGASAAAVNFGGTGTSYTWVNSTPSIGLSANGTGDIAAFTTTNTSSVPVIGTITLTPQYTNAGLTCSGTAQQFTIAVNPTPVVQDPSDVTLCNNNVTNPITFTGSGTYYNWTNDTPAIGLNATGTGTIPAFLAQNSSTSTPLTAQLTVTAYFEQSNVTCTGNTQTFTISVNPTPVVTDPLDQEVCNGSSTANVVFDGTGTSYTWTNTNTAIGVGAGAIGNIAPFTGLNATAAQISGLFSVTPIYTSANGVACPGNPQEFTIAVNPSPVVTPIPNFTVCNGETINVPLTANITSNFTWYADPNTNVTGDVNIPQPSSTVINTLTNITTTMQYVTYRVNPVSAPQGCSGLQTTFVVEVVPDVELTSDPSIEICSGASVNMILTANVPSTFTWIATDNVNVTGEALFAQSGNIINNLLINNTTQNQIVIYSIIPTSDPAGCVGAARTIAVIVRPPLALLNEDTVTICSGESVDLTLEANVAAGFNWYATNNININGESTTIQTTNLINDVLVNTSNSVQQVDYQAVATSTVNGCASPIFDIVVFVNPLPFVTNVAGAICSGENVNTPITSTQPSIYTWQAQPNGIVTGESIALQNSSTINDVLFNTSNSAQIVNYDILPTDLNTGCKGPIFTLPITVNPLPNVSFNTGTGPLCNLTPVPFNNTSDNGLDYAWSFGDGNGSILEDPVYSYPAIGTYTVTLTGTNQQTGCVNSYSTDITLAESPVVDFAASEPEGCVVFNTEFSDLINAPGTSLFWDFGDGETSNQPGTVDHQYPDAGCYDVSLTVTNEAGCTITLLQEDIVCAYAIPDAEFIVSSDSIPIGNPTIEFTNQSTDALTYVWDFGDGTTSTSTNPIHVYPTEPAEYVVTLYAYNELGCYDSMIMTITVWEDLLVYVPNSFTPNEDGTNDVFLPLMTSGFDPNSYELWVFNRWGEVVFYTNDPQAGWDGKYPDFLEELILQSSDNYAQDGVYTWKVQFTGLQNEDAYVYVGTVTLLR